MAVEGINFASAFGNRSTNVQGNGAPSKDEQQKAQYWLNVGYVVTIPSTVEGAAEGDTEERFVSLPTGIPLDTQKPLQTNSRNESFAAFQSARNDLLDQIMKVAENMEPGAEHMLNLKIQLRRVNGEREAIAPETNVFALKNDLLAG